MKLNFIQKIEKKLLEMLLLFSTLAIVYLVYIYPILKYIFRIYVIPYGHAIPVLIAFFVINYCTINLYERYIPIEKT